MKSGPVAITGLRTIVERFDHVLLDQWGTLHKGEAIFPEAYECVARLREAGKKVLVLSNSGKRANDNEQRLAALGCRPRPMTACCRRAKLPGADCMRRSTNPSSVSAIPSS